MTSKNPIKINNKNKFRGCFSIRTKLLKVVQEKYIKIFLAFLDQGVFSTSNFVVNLLLARWLPDNEYGAFAVSYAVYILASTVQGALILEPISIFGPIKIGENLTIYFNKQLIFHIQINLLVSFIVLICSFLAQPPLQNDLIGTAIAIPCTFLVWLFRRFCYIRMRTGLATIISFVYSASLFFGIFFLSQYRILSPFLVYCLMGLSSVISISLLSSYLDIKINRLDLFKKIFFLDTQFINESWLYGKWILVAMIADSIINLVYVPLIAFILGMNHAAGFRAVLNFLMPIQQIQAAISLMVVPWLSRKAELSQSILGNKILFQITCYFVLPTILYSIPILIFSKTLVQIIYKNSLYDSFIWMIPHLLFSSIFSSFALVLAIYLRTIRLSKPIFFSKASASIMTLILGIIFVYYIHLPGVIIVLYISIFIESLVLFLAAIQVRKKTIKI